MSSPLKSSLNQVNAALEAVTETTDDSISFGHLLSPIKVGPVELKNRFWLAPMSETMCGVNGETTEQMISYYAARAKGGAAVVSTGAIMGTHLASEFVWGRHLVLLHQGHLQGLGLLTDHIHYFGAKAAAQMTIGFGRQGHSHDQRKSAPSPTAGLPYEIAVEKGPAHASGAFYFSERPRAFMVGQMTREITIDEIRQNQKEFANSCQLAVCAGFDIIEIHASHGYLEHQFLSRLTNKRTDMYGGEWRNRKRFLNEIVEQIRYACPGVVLGVRLSAEEHMQGGLTEEEMIDVAQDCQARGVDYVSLSDGAGYEEGGHLITDMDRSKHLPEHGLAFKNALKVPVIVSSQHNPVKSNQNIGDGKYDIQALGRQLFADPEYPNKISSGRAKDIIRCQRCNICFSRCQIGLVAACPNNPNLGREFTLEEYKIGPWQKHEQIIPEGVMRVPMPALERPWWKREIDLLEKCWRPLQGRTCR